MTIRFELYKISQEKFSPENANSSSEKYYIHRMSTNAFENININLSTPVSPMPLPEDTSSSNMLVKMEGNTKIVRFSFKFSNELVDISKEVNLDYQNSNSARELITDDGGKLLDVVRYYNNTTSAYVNYPFTPISDTNNVSKISTFLSYFENFSITDTFIVRLYDTTASKEILKYGGSLTGVDCTADSGSPVVWTVNIDFLVGNVISIYDADTPDQVNGFDAWKSATNSLSVKWKAPDRSGGSSITKYTITALHTSDSDKKVTTIITTPTDSNSDGFFDTVINNAFFTSGSDWTVFMYATNTGGRGTNSDEIHVVF